MTIVGAFVLVLGAGLIFTAFLLAMSSDARSLMNLFVPSVMRFVEDGFFATSIARDTIAFVGCILIVLGIAAMVL